MRLHLEGSPIIHQLDWALLMVTEAYTAVCAFIGTSW